MPPINRLLNQTATIVKKLASTSPDPNVVVYDTGVDVACRIQTASNTLVTNQYRDIKIDMEMWLLPDTDISEEDRVTYDGVNYAVNDIDIKTARLGVTHHKKLLLIREKTNG